MNLIDAGWVSVQRAAGEAALIAPWQIAEGQGSEYQTLAALRPDFNGAMAQFLIGLLQTAFAPEDDKAWRTLWNQPPAPEALQAAFDVLRDAFELDGDGPRFMQDLTLREGEEKPVAGLLMDSPGGNTVRNNQDHFIKRDIVSALCPHCAALALFSLQTNAPSGGQGHRVGLRGGGPLTTLLVPRGTGDAAPLGLWHSLWLNVLPKSKFQAPSAKGEVVFPWLAPTITSEKNQKVWPHQQAHPLQMFWGMPRRIRLNFETVTGCCDLCGVASEERVTSYFTRNFGTSYEGWEHVLSPHSQDSAEAFALPVHGQPGGIGYRHWTGLVVSDEEAKTKGRRRPAVVVSHHKDTPERRRIDVDLWVFGYDFDNMKARAWVESRVPLLMAEERQGDFEVLSRAYVQAAEEMFGYLRSMVKAALFGEPEFKGDKTNWRFPPNAPKDGTVFETLSNDFWRRGEESFFAHLHNALACDGDDQREASVTESWLRTLTQQALACFDDAVKSIESSDSRVKATVFARSQLLGMARGKALRKVTGLPSNEEKTAKPGKGTKA